MSITIPNVGEFTDQADLASFIAKLSPEKQQSIAEQLSGVKDPGVILQPVQQQVLDSEADFIFMGGSAGGSKTFTACYLACYEHIVTTFIRREYSQFQAIFDEIAKMLGNRNGLNTSAGIWRFDNGDGIERTIRFRGLSDPTSHLKLQGQAADLLIFDELCSIRHNDFIFVKNWLRTTDHRVKRTRLFATFNPPTSAEGLYVTEMLAAWLSPRYQGTPAESGELRWFNAEAGRMIEVPDDTPIKLEDGSTVKPISMTFIRAGIKDNKYLGDDYMAALNAQPEPLRSQLLFGDMTALSSNESEFQLIPSKHVQAAMDRWEASTPLGDRDLRGTLTGIAVDVARGGIDDTVIMKRYDTGNSSEGPWIAPIEAYPGVSTPDGNSIATLVMGHVQDGAPVMIDAIGVGSSPTDRLLELNMHVHQVIGSQASGQLTKSGTLGFVNEKSARWWALRELLAPESEIQLMLPSDPMLFADLTSMMWELQGNRIRVSTKKQIKEILGRSPDRGDTLSMLMLDIPPLGWEEDGRRDRPARADLDIYGHRLHKEAEYVIGADGQYSQRITDPGPYDARSPMHTRRRRVKELGPTDEELDYNPCP